MASWFCWKTLFRHVVTKYLAGFEALLDRRTAVMPASTGREASVDQNSSSEHVRWERIRMAWNRSSDSKSQEGCVWSVSLDP